VAAEKKIRHAMMIWTNGCLGRCFGNWLKFWVYKGGRELLKKRGEVSEPCAEYCAMSAQNGYRRKRSEAKKTQKKGESLDRP